MSRVTRTFRGFGVAGTARRTQRVSALHREPGVERQITGRGAEEPVQEPARAEQPHELGSPAPGRLGRPDSRRHPSTGCRRPSPGRAATAPTSASGSPSPSLPARACASTSANRSSTKNPAAELLAEERDIRPDDRAQIHQDRTRHDGRAPRAPAAAPWTCAGSAGAAYVRTGRGGRRPPSFRRPHLNNAATGRPWPGAPRRPRANYRTDAAAAGVDDAAGLASPEGFTSPDGFTSAGRLAVHALGTLHVDAAAEVRPVGNRDARRRARSPSTDPLSRMSTRSVAVMLPCTSPCTMIGLGDDLGLDLAVRPDGQDVLLAARSSRRPAPRSSDPRCRSDHL